MLIKVEYDGINFMIGDIGSQPLQMSVIVAYINQYLSAYKIKSLTAEVVNDWLSYENYLYSGSDGEGKLKREIAELGRQCGISSESRVNANGEEYSVLLYGKEMQGIIYNSVKQILIFRDKR